MDHRTTRRALSRVVALACLVALATGHAATAQTAGVELGLFERLCFPDLKNVAEVAARAHAAGWEKAEPSDDPRLARALGNLIGSPRTRSADLYKTRADGRTFYAIVQAQESGTGDEAMRIIKCHLYGFDSRRAVDDVAFRRRFFPKTEALVGFGKRDGPIPDKLAYLRIHGRYFPDATSGERYPDERGLVGVYLLASQPAQ